MTSPQPSARLRPFRPSPFGRYTLLFPLSTGGMGEIYLARLEGTQGFEKLCVIKKILPQLASDPQFVTRFVNEAKTVVKLSHGSIAQVLDMGVFQEEPYLALEHVDGKDLRRVSARMRDRDLPMPLTFVLYVMSRVLDALAYAHRKRDEEEKEINLVHRDISPQNILISYEGEVKVIDFGLAKSTLNSAKTNPAIILGKFLYMSPEQARHQPVDRRSDLYAVGVCLYELIAGANPFEASAPGDLIEKVANPQIPPLRSLDPLCPGNVAAVVSKALEVDPARRFQSAEEFRGKLLSCLVEIDPSAGPESVSRFMREAFSTDYAQERRLLASLRDQLKAPAHGELRGPSPEEDTAVFSLQAVAPSAEAALALASPLPDLPRVPQGPIEPTALSFAPTPRTSEALDPMADGETLPSIVSPPERKSPPPVNSSAALGASTGRPANSGLRPALPEYQRAGRASIPTPPSGFAKPPPPVPDEPSATLQEEEEASAPIAPIPTGSQPMVVLGTLLEPTPSPVLIPIPKQAELSEPPEAVITYRLQRSRSPWVFVLPVLVLTLGVAAYFIYDLQRTGALRSMLGGPAEPRPAPTAQRRPGEDPAVSANAATPAVEDGPEEPLAIPGVPDPSPEPPPEPVAPPRPAPPKPPRPEEAAFLRAKAARDKLDGRWGCDLAGGKVALLCKRFDRLEAGNEELKERGGRDPGFIRSANRLSEEIQAQLKKKQP